MRTRFFLFAVLFPAALGASAQERAMRCSSGTLHHFSGSPFLPDKCVAPGAKDPEDIETQAPPAALKGAASSPKELLGRWTGFSNFGGNRYQLLLDVRLGSGDSYIARVTLKDYSLHFKNVFWVTLATATAGTYRADIWLDALPQSGLDGWVQFAGTKENGFSRLARLTYDERQSVYEARYLLKDKGTLSFEYEIKGAQPTPPTSGELKRTDQTELPF